MIVTFTPNPAIDVTYRLNHLRVGESHRLPSGMRRAGGKGINVARVLHEQGERVLVLAPVGGPTGDALVRDLAAAGLPHSVTPVHAETRSTFAIVTERETTNLNERGGTLTFDEWRLLVTSVERAAAASTAIVCSGSLPPGAPADLAAQVVRLGSAAGVPVVVDVHGDQLVDAVRAGAAAVKPNRDELLATMGGSDVVEAARRLARLGTATVFASVGASGMFAVTRDDAWHAKLDSCLQGNPTGAGDAAVAAIARALVAGRSVQEQLARATAWSAAAVLAPQAGSITDPAPLAARISVEKVAQ